AFLQPIRFPRPSQRRLAVVYPSSLTCSHPERTFLQTGHSVWLCISTGASPKLWNSPCVYSTQNYAAPPETRLISGEQSWYKAYWKLRTTCKRIENTFANIRDHFYMPRMSAQIK